MELHHLHVAESQAVAQRHGEAIHGLVARGRVVLVHRRPAAGGQQYGVRLDQTECTRADVDEEHGAYCRRLHGVRPMGLPPTLRDQRHRAVLLEPPDRPRPDLLHQPVDDLDAGEIALVHSAIERLAGEGLAVQRPIRIAVEETADLVFQFLHAFDRFGHQRPGKILVGQPFAAVDGVHEMPLD